MSAEKERTVELDGIRGIAIALVLVNHFVVLHYHATVGSPLAYLGVLLSLSWSGVTLFFVLSGFLIGGILLDHRDSPALLKTFYLRRAFRILPLYFLFLVAAAGIFALQRNGISWLPSAADAHPWWSYATFTMNLVTAAENDYGNLMLGPLWSLCVEEQFYLLAPLLFLTVPRRRIGAVLVGLMAVAYVLRVALLVTTPDPGTSVRVLMPTCMDTLAAGMLLAWVVRDEQWRARGIRWGRAWLPLMVLGGVAYAWVAHENFHGRQAAMIGYGYSTLALLYALMIAGVVLVRQEWWCRLLRTGWLVDLGRHAYCIYLVHMAVELASAGWAESMGYTTEGFSIARRLAAVFVTWFIARLSWRFFEEPLVNFGRRYRY